MATNTLANGISSEENTKSKCCEEIVKVQESNCKCRIALKAERLVAYVNSLTSIRKEVVDFNNGNYSNLVAKLDVVLTKLKQDGIYTCELSDCLYRLSHMEITKKELLVQLDKLIERVNKIIELEELSKEKASFKQLLSNMAAHSDEIFDIIYPDKKIV